MAWECGERPQEPPIDAFGLRPSHLHSRSEKAALCLKPSSTTSQNSKASFLGAGSQSLRTACVALATVHHPTTIMCAIRAALPEATLPSNGVVHSPFPQGWGNMASALPTNTTRSFSALFEMGHGFRFTCQDARIKRARPLLRNPFCSCSRAQKQKHGLYNMSHLSTAPSH